MAMPPRQSPPSHNEIAAGDFGSALRADRLSEGERDALREHAGRARTDAAAAAARYASLSAEVARLEGSEGKRGALSAARQDLEATTSDFARLLRLLDTPPERALTLLKEAVNERVAQHSPEGRAVMEDVVRWGVRAFYDGVA
jgi:hypothetical protein